MRRLPLVGTLLVVLALAPGLRAQRSDTLALSLPDALARALSVSEEMRTARAQIDIADAQIGIARAGALPALRVNGAYTHVIENARAQAIGSVFNQPNTYTVNANLSQPLFQGGRAVGAWRVARNARSAARLSAQEARAQLSLDVLSAYLQALLGQRLVEIQQGNVQLATTRVTLAEQQFGAGRAARYDVLRARVERANLDPQRIAAEGDRDLALLALAQLVNVPPGAPLRLTSRIDGDIVATALASLGVDTASAVERASVRAARASVEARRAAVTVARADWLPTLSVFVQSGYQAFPFSGLPPLRGALEDAACPSGRTPPCTAQNGGFFSDRQLGVLMSWPLFDGLRAKSTMDLARAQMHLAQVALASERERAEADIALARSQLSRARAMLAARHETVGEAEETFKLASLRQRRGIGTALEVSDAQLAQLVAQTDEARAAFDAYVAAAALSHALGRPIPLPAEGPPTPLSHTSNTMAMPDGR